VAKATEQPPALRAPVGAKDVLPPESARWEEMVARFSFKARLAGFRLILPPLFEDVAVFSRGVGTSSDIVSKEMYEFEDRGGRRLALRPEATASVARAFVEHRPQVLPWKVWYAGPMFRYERPQAARQRQFYQLGAELLGTDDPAADVETIALAWDFLDAVGVIRKTLSVNSLGDSQCRPAFRSSLVEFFSARASSLCAEHRERYLDNPMRVLDCKRAECTVASQDAPRQIDSLCAKCHDAFAAVVEGLTDLGIEHRVDTRLVRGLDYYTRTTFEIASPALASAQNALGGGGRYDALVEMLGGPPTPAVGFSLGMERTLLALDAEGVPHGAEAPDAYVVDLTGGRQASLIARELRLAGLACERDFGGRSAKAQLRAADRSGARLAIIVGPDELESGTVTFKPLRPASGEDGPGLQRSLPREGLVEALKKELS
jgi:histidyl-tRNA synthetase